MKLSDQEVRYVADLANLKLTDVEVQRMGAELSDILTHIDKLNELDTSAVEPMAQVLYEAEETATLREDVERTPFDNLTALANAPLSSAGCFKVPLVIDK